MTMLFRLCMIGLHAASWMVCEEDRYEWLREWASELWHIHAAVKNAPLREQMEMLRFARGAFSDAFWLAVHNRRLRGWKLPVFHSPLQCLIALFVLALAATGLALIHPEIRNAVLPPSTYEEARSLVLIARDGYTQTEKPSVRLDEFRNWTRNTQHLYSELAFYQMLERRVHIGHGSEATLSIARSSNNLFHVIDSPSLSGNNVSLIKDKPQALLSEAAWRTLFHRDRHIIGHTLLIAGEKAIIIGVAARDSWQLPGKADVWLLETDARMNELPMGAMGFVVARLQTSLLNQGAGDSLHMLVPNGDGDYSGFTCTVLIKRLREPLYLFAFTAMLALLALPATTSLPLGDYPLHPGRQSWSIRIRRWVFLAAKLLLLVPILCFGPIAITHWAASLQATTVASIQGCITFATTLFALRWMLRDQRRRCPVCLQLLRNPVRVGQPSRNFLAWNGTELICVGGHGFLHVPELPTSWCSTQRWLYLDPSWRTLFRPPVPISF